MVIQEAPFNRDPANLLRAFTSNFYDTYYRPLHRITFVLDAQLGGSDLVAYHRTNALLHALGSMAVFGALLTLGYAGSLAASGGLVFAVHPALASAVAWIPGRDNVLLTIFLLGSLAAWSRFLRRPAGGTAWLGLHWALFAPALFTKEAALGFPAIALAYAGLWQGEPLRSRRLAVAGIGWIAALVLFLTLRANALPFARDWDAVGADALVRSWPAAFALLGKLVLPLRLSAFARLDAVPVATGVAAVVGAALLVARCERVRAPRVLFGAAWFAVLLAPTLIQRTGLYDYGEYRLYWLAFGVWIVAVELLRGLRLDPGRPRVALGIALVCALLAGRTLVYQRVFDGPLRFWTQMVDVDPGSGWGWFHVGRTHYRRGELDAALAAYGRAREVGFERVDLYADLAAARLDAEDWSGAAAAAERALELDPGHLHALANLGSARLQLGAYREAREALTAALDPRDPERFRYAAAGERAAFRARVLEQLGSARYALGERPEAEREWRAALELDPDRHGARLKLIDAALRRGEVARAGRLAVALERRGGQLPPALRRRLARAAGPGPEAERETRASRGEP